MPMLLSTPFSLNEQTLTSSTLELPLQPPVQSSECEKKNSIRLSDLTASSLEASRPLICRGWKWVRQKGSPNSVVTWSEHCEVLAPLDKQIRVRIFGAGINAADNLIEEEDIEKNRSCGVGLEGMGRVESVGWSTSSSSAEEQQACRSSLSSDSHDLVLGDWVLVLAPQRRKVSGTFCEYVTVDAERAIKISSGASFPVAFVRPSPSFMKAAVLPIAGATAFLALRDVLRVEKGYSILIHGASGGVGSFAVHLAHHFGLHVIASCSSSHTEYVVQHGADCVLDYTSVKSIAKAAREATNEYGVDYVLDASSGNVSESLSTALRFGGSMCVVSSQKRHCDANFVWAQQLTVSYFSLEHMLYDPRGLTKWRAAVENLYQLLLEGVLEVHIESVDFRQASQALDVVGEGHVLGKLLLTIH